MSINLSNLKAGKSVVTDTLAVTKIGSDYKISYKNVDGTWTLWFDKVAKVWSMISDATGQKTIFEGETAKTVADAAEMAIFNAQMVEIYDQQPAEEPAKTPSKELVLVESRSKELVLVKAEEPAEAAEEPETAEAESDTVKLDYEVDTTGNHTQHRAAALATIAYALGAEVSFTRGKGNGYHGQAILSMIVPAEDAITVLSTLERFTETVEPLAVKVSREASHRGRLAGAHHSSWGYYARAGFVRGYAREVAERIFSVINPGAEIDFERVEKIAGAAKFDKIGWEQGLIAAGDFEL